MLAREVTGWRRLGQRSSWSATYRNLRDLCSNTAVERVGVLVSDEKHSIEGRPDTHEYLSDSSDMKVRKIPCYGCSSTGGGVLVLVVELGQSGAFVRWLVRNS